MRNWIEVISRKIGFTKTETQIVLFILAAFAVGAIVLYSKTQANEADYLEFDYSAEDSLFNAALGNVDMDDVTKKDSIEKRVASKNELLDFGSGKKKDAVIPMPKSLSSVVNINTASASELSSLPGIGSKTAENILAYRKQKGKFSKTDQLLNIKGIGKAKLAKLREHIKFE